MNKDYQIAHAWGQHCEKCRKIFGIEQEICPECGEMVYRVMSAFQVPRGCIFVYDDGAVPGGHEWVRVSDKEYEKWQENRPRPGRS